MPKAQYYEELNKLVAYLKSESSEDARRPLLYPLFQKLFKEKFRIESDACGADIYIAGQLIVESKTNSTQWLEGFYQALHYQKKYGLAFHTVMVIANRFVAVWKLNKLPEYAVIFSKTADAQTAPSTVGKELASRTQKPLMLEIKNSALYWLDPKELETNYFSGGKSLKIESYEILKILNNLDSDRLQINQHNFISTIERLKPFFSTAIEAVHAFYTIVAYWDITSKVSVTDSGEVHVTGFNGVRMSDAVPVSPRYIREFGRFVESQYIFTNEGSGLTVDYYFSRFDEVLAKMDPEYVKQHGIFFTDSNLSRFALWFAKYHFPGNIDENYIVFDPAGGSGNLVSSWRGRLKHKIISELQPDLLRIIERRMRVDPFHVESGFTIIPKTSKNTGLNFLDKSAGDYMAEIRNELNLKNVTLDKPLAFLLNPPYKNTDENVAVREQTESHYHIHPSVLELTGEDAGKERYLAFLGQILNICRDQARGNENLKPVVMIFTPSSWLIPRPTYIAFRKIWDKHFRFHCGFIITSNEFFKLEGRWPLAFTIWIYDNNIEGNQNSVTVTDLTHLSRKDLDKNWNTPDEELITELNSILNKAHTVKLDNIRGDIRTKLNKVIKNNKLISQPRYNMYRNLMKSEKIKEIVSGFPIKDERHKTYKVPYGFTDGIFVGFMDDNTPIRLYQDTCQRMTNKPDRVWFMLMSAFSKVNVSQAHSGAANSRSFCSYNLESAKVLFEWFSISKAVFGTYPLWANQFEIWSPIIKPEYEKYWYSLCFAFVLAENRCVVTKFEKDNPVVGAPEVFVDNPLCPANPECFWSTTLDKEIIAEPGAAIGLVNKIKELYRHWNMQYCKGQWLYNVGLQNEPYFKYFDYADFLTPYSGLIQIRRYAEQEGLSDLQELFRQISELTKKAKQEIYRLLVEEFGYFE